MGIYESYAYQDDDLLIYMADFEGVFVRDDDSSLSGKLVSYAISYTGPSTQEVTTTLATIPQGTTSAFRDGDYTGILLADATTSEDPIEEENYSELSIDLALNFNGNSITGTGVVVGTGWYYGTQYPMDIYIDDTFTVYGTISGATYNLTLVNEVTGWTYNCVCGLDSVYSIDSQNLISSFSTAYGVSLPTEYFRSGVTYVELLTPAP